MPRAALVTQSTPLQRPRLQRSRLARTPGTPSRTSQTRSEVAGRPTTFLDDSIKVKRRLSAPYAEPLMISGDSALEPIGGRQAMDALLMGKALPKPVAAARTPARPWTPGKRATSDSTDAPVTAAKKENSGPLQVFPTDENNEGSKTLFGMALRWISENIAYYLTGTAGDSTPVPTPAVQSKGKNGEGAADENNENAGVKPGYSSPLNRKVTNPARIRVWSPVGPYTGTQR